MMTLERFLMAGQAAFLLCSLLMAGVGLHWVWSWAVCRWSARELTRIPTRWL